MKKKKCIGWLERAVLSFRDAEGRDVTVPLRAKMDTGAEGTAVSAHLVRFFRRAGKNYVEFRIPGQGKETMTAPLLGKVIVRSSNGEAARRVLIRGHLLLGAHAVSIQLALADRSKMEFPMLVGRRTLKGRFLVDCGKRFLLKRQKTAHRIKFVRAKRASFSR